MGRRQVGVLAVVVAAVAGPLGLAAAAPAAAASGPAAPASARAVTATGNDIAAPQCGSTFPSGAGFGVVGVDGGVVFSANPCLGTGNGPSELAWARQTPGGAQLYANTGDPGPAYSTHWPLGQTSPRTCAATDPNSPACSYDYGWNAATASFSHAVAAQEQLGTAAAAAPAAVAALAWWLDVETANSWQTLETGYGPTQASQANDTAALSGEVAYLSSQQVSQVGLYSTDGQWTQITGGAPVTGAAFAANPEWVTGAASSAAAQQSCSGSGFAGGPVGLSQFVPATGDDVDYACASAAPGSGFVALQPQRVLDTRASGAPLQPGTPRVVPVTQGTGVPAGATAVAVTVTAIDPAGGGNVRIWPDGAALPATSVVNLEPGVDTADTTVVALPSDGALRVQAFGSATGLALDVTGYLAAGSAYTPVGPTRVLDTRSGAALTGGSVRRVALPGAPSGAVAAVLTVTSVDPAGPGNLRVWAAGAAEPATSVVNYVPGVDVADGAVVGLGPGATVDLGGFGATANATVDLVGYLGSALADGAASSRLASAQPLAPGTPLQVSVPGGRQGQVVAVTVTAVDPSGPGNLRVYTGGQAPPPTSVVNLVGGRDSAGLTFVALGPGATLEVATYGSAVSVDVDLDQSFAVT